MYRLLSNVTARTATTAGPAWSGGRRGAHRRPGLPVLGLGWAGGLGLGLGLALGAKLVVGLRGAVPVQSPADPETSGATELPLEQAPGPGIPHAPVPPAARGFSRAIESSRDLLHRIKVRAQWASGRRLQRKTFRFLTAWPRAAQVAAEVTSRGHHPRRGPPLPFLPLPLLRASPAHLDGRGHSPGGRGRRVGGLSSSFEPLWSSFLLG